MNIAKILLAVVLAMTPCMADDSTARLKQYEAEIAAERAALAELRVSQQRDTAELSRKVATAAANLLNRQLELDATKDKVAALRRQLAAQEEADSASYSRIHTIMGAATQTATQMEILLGECPGRDDDHTAVATLLGQLQAISDEQPPPVGSIEQLLMVLDGLHHDACTTTVRKVQIHRPNGEPEHVTLAAVSNAHFMYTTNSGITAVAINSPADAAGYRWQEQLAAGQQLAITRALADLQAKKLALVPVDVTQSLRVTDDSVETSWQDELVAGGPLMIPIGLVALLACILMLERSWVWWRQRESSAQIASVLKACEESRFTDAVEALRRHGRSFTARLLLTALEHRDNGQQAVEDAIETRLLQDVPQLRRRLNGISVLGAVAPLLGLLGTVTGIIQTFSVIKGAGVPDAGLMAGGISQALVTTAAGLIVAIPILLMHRALAGAMDRIVCNGEAHAATLVTLLSRRSS